MKKALLLCLVLLTVATFVSANGKDDGTITIGCNIYNFQDNFMNGAIKPELESYAAAKGVVIDIVDSEGQQAKLNDQVDIFITKKVDALAINLVDPAAASTIIAKAKKADIPLILFNKEATEAGAMKAYDKVWYVGTNSAESGMIQGDMMVADWKANPAWDLNGDGKVQYVMLKGEPGHPDAEARTKYSVKAFHRCGYRRSAAGSRSRPQLVHPAR